MSTWQINNFTKPIPRNERKAKLNTSTWTAVIECIYGYAWRDCVLYTNTIYLLLAGGIIFKNLAPKRKIFSILYFFQKHFSEMFYAIESIYMCTCVYQINTRVYVLKIYCRKISIGINVTIKLISFSHQPPLGCVGVLTTTNIDMN